MNKKELARLAAQKHEIPPAAAEKIVDTLLEAVTETLAAGGRVTLNGFGSFETRERSARTGRNPATGAPVEIPACRKAQFKPGKALRDALDAAKS